MSQAKWAGPPRARHLGGQSCEDVSGETARTTSRTASWSPLLRGCLRRNAQSRTTQKREFRGCLRRNGQNHNILLRTSRRDHPSAGTSFYHNSTPVSTSCLGKKARAPSWEGETGWPTTSGQGIWEPRVARMSQAKRPGPPRERQLGDQNCEDVSGEMARTTRFL